MRSNNNSAPLKPVKGGFSARLRYGNGLRGRFIIALVDEAAAERRRQALQDLANLLAKAGKHPQAPIILRKAAALKSESEFKEVVRFAERLCTSHAKSDQPPTPSVKELGKDWTSGKLHEKYPDQIPLKRSVKADIARLVKHVYPVIGEKPIDSVTLDDCERVMRSLPEKLATASRRNVGQTLARLLAMAVYPLRLIDRSPVPSGFLPRTPKHKAMACLYPSEDARLMRSAAVPLAYRLLWGFLTREGMRIGEALALTYGDLDLVRGAIKLDKNKTDEPRAWAMAPGVPAALKSYRDKYRKGAQPSDLVFLDSDGNEFDALELAGTLRDHLGAIGLKKERPELFSNTTERIMMRVHDLRGAFVTIALANGRSESWISDRTGHKSSQMIAKYKRPARTIDELHEDDLLPLDQAIPELTNPRPTLGPSKRNPAKARARRGGRISRNSRINVHTPAPVCLSNPLVAGSSPAGRANRGPPRGPPCRDESHR